MVLQALRLPQSGGGSDLRPKLSISFLKNFLRAVTLACESFHLLYRHCGTPGIGQYHVQRGRGPSLRIFPIRCESYESPQGAGLA